MATSAEVPTRFYAFTYSSELTLGRGVGVGEADVLLHATNHSHASTHLRSEPPRTQPSSSPRSMPSTMGQPGPTFADPRRRARLDGAIAAALEAAAVASPRGSKSFARPGAIVSLHRRPRDQARSGQGSKGAGNIGPWCRSSTIVRAAGAGMSTAVLGRWPSD